MHELAYEEPNEELRERFQNELRQVLSEGPLRTSELKRVVGQRKRKVKAETRKSKGEKKRNSRNRRNFGYA